MTHDEIDEAYSGISDESCHELMDWIEEYYGKY